MSIHTLYRRLLVFVIFPTLLLICSSFFGNIYAAGYGPSDVKAAYNLPDSGGQGQTVAIIGPYDATAESDLAMFDSTYQLSDCTQANGCLTIHEMNGPGQFGANDAIETALDTQWVHGIAPSAKILLVVPGSMQTQDMMDAINYANSQQGINAVSMSFGVQNADGQVPCDVFSNSSIAYFAATGDNGTDLEWPAVCPQVIAVGGTTLRASGANSTETAWRGSGGGLSQMIPEPSYQTAFNIPNANGFRGVPDVGAIADPATGVTIVYMGQKRPTATGGTSLATPVWAAISAINGSPITHEQLYANASSAKYSQYYRDITQGSNGGCGPYCTANVGYDYITGLGSPIALPGSGGSVGPRPTPTPGGKAPTPTPTPSQSSSQDWTLKASAYCNGLDSQIKVDYTIPSGRRGVLELYNSTGKNACAPGSPIDDFSCTQYSAGSCTNYLTGSGTYIVTGNQIQACPAPKNKLVVGENYNIQMHAGDDGPAGPDSSMVVNVYFKPVACPLTPSPTKPVDQEKTPTPTSSSNSGGSGGFEQNGTPTPTPDQYYSCVPDPTCVQSGKSIQLCPLKCSPQ